MNNTLNVNYLTQAYGSLLNGYEIAQNLTRPAKFLSMLSNANPVISPGTSELSYGNPISMLGSYLGNPGLLNGAYTNSSAKVNASANLQGTGNTQAVSQKAISREDMTMEKYKQYLYDQFSKIPIHPSRSLESISINITDAGFEAMKNDPEYEAWVLDDLKAGWAQPNPWTAICGGGYSVIHYGAAKEECNASSWYPGYQHGKGESLFNSRSENSFWERRTESQKLYQEQSQTAALERYYQQQCFSMFSGFFG